MNKLFNNEIVNKGRQKELDLAKGFAIIFMIVCHIGLYFAKPNTFLYEFSDIIGGEFAAPVFMVCLGVGVVFAKHNEPKDLIKRGINVFLLGYLLNFCRETIFVIIGNIINKPYSLRNFYDSLMFIDIMQFAGLAFIVLALFKKHKITPVQQVMIGLLCAGLGEILANKSTCNIYLDDIFGLIWGTCEVSCFPLLNWLIFPCFGVLFGELLQHCNDKNVLYKRIFLICLIGVLTSYYLILFTDDYYNNGSYYYMGIKNVIYALCYPMSLFAICQYIAEKTEVEDLPIVGFCSKYLNTSYCISWVIIFGTRYVCYDLMNIDLNNMYIVVAMFVILIITYYVTKMYVNIKSNKVK